MSTTDAINKFKARYPALVTAFSLTDPQIEVFLEEAAIEVSKCAYGAYYQKALFLHAAHFLTIESYANAFAIDPETANTAFTAVGGISTASVGDVSVTRNLMQAGDDSESQGTFPATVYGQQFLRLRNKMGKGALLANQRVASEGCANPDSPGIML